jgi:hypothetical protein
LFGIKNSKLIFSDLSTTTRLILEVSY